MSSDNAPKNIIEVYWEKYSDDRKQISEYLKETFLYHPAVVFLITKVVWVIYQPYKWLFIVPFLAFSTTTLTLITVITAIMTNARTAGKIAVLWARSNSYVTPMTVNVTGQENIDKNQSYVIVANHLSQYDIYVLYGWLGIDIRWVMKKELRKIPVLGFVCKILQHIYIDRSDSEKAIASINAAKKKIKDGTSIIFFPEGSRSPDGKLQPFKKGAFKLAVDLNLPVLPVTINGTHKILGKGTMNLMPGTTEMIIHEPIIISKYDESTIKELSLNARSVIKSKLTS